MTFYTNWYTCNSLPSLLAAREQFNERREQIHKLRMIFILLCHPWVTTKQNFLHCCSSPVTKYTHDLYLKLLQVEK